MDESILSMNLLTFRQKSFSYERTCELGGIRYCVFHRTETESEAKLRPRLLALYVVAPLDAILLDETEDALVMSPDGKARGPAITGTAIETAAEPDAFDEQGLAWSRRRLGPDRFVYVPRAVADTLLAPAGLQELGLAGWPGARTERPGDDG